MGTLTSAGGAVASSVAGPSWLAIILWLLVAIGVVVTIVLTLTDRDNPEATVTTGEQGGSDNAQAIAATGGTAISQSGPGLNIAAQGEGHTINYYNSPTEQSDDRVWVHLTPEELMGIYENETTLRANRRFAEFVGKWKKVDGILAGVSNTYYTQVHVGEALVGARVG